MPESIDGNVAVEFAVDARQYVERELGGDPFGIVIGGDQPVDGLYAVHADQQLRARSEERAELPQQVSGGGRHEIADRRTGEEAKPRQGFDPAGQAERPSEVGDHGNDVEPGKALLKLRRALLEIIAGK